MVRHDLTQELRRVRPVYVFVDREAFGYEQLLIDKYPDFCELLARDYVKKSETPGGVWYERRGE